MKYYLLFFFSLLFPLCGFAQNLSNASTFKKTLELAKKKEKPILLIISPDYPPEVQARVAVGSVLLNDEVVSKAKENFVVFDTKRTDTSMRSIISTYKIMRYPAFIFMHPTRDVFHVDFGMSSTKHKYLAMFEKAMAMSKEKTATDLQVEYLKNPNDIAILKQLIEIRKRNGITDNAELIETYVQGLKMGDFNDYATVLFILEAGPYADGNAYKLAYTNRKIIDSIYKRESVQVRQAINNGVIVNTMTGAVRTKNMQRAIRGASLSRSAWKNDYLRGQKSYNSQMLYYYNATKDTTNYFKLAVQHYDSYYMNLSADSIKRAEVREREAMLERIKPTMQHKNIVSKEKIDSLAKANPANVRRESFVTSTPSSNYAGDLNNIAYQFYQKGTKNLNYLSKAMLWSKRAIELNPIWNYYDTLAHIYYAMGIHSEALATQKLAVDLAKKETNPEYFTRTNQEYEKMKNKSL
jgi:tetratricopeptide (TPR) repeat protein